MADARPSLELPQWRVLHGQVPKHDSTIDECQDAIRVECDSRVRIAVADGATQGSKQGLWAQLLARAAIERPPPVDLGPTALRDWLLPVRDEWHRARAAQSSTSDSHWFASHAQQTGAASTLLFVELNPRGDLMHWRALALGDTCVLVYSKQEVFCSFPIEQVAQFDTRPALLYTQGDEDADWRQAEGELEPGELLLVATDAVAKALLSRPNVIDRLGVLTSDDEIVGFLRRLQSRDYVDDDDLSLVLVRASATFVEQTKTTKERVSAKQGAVRPKRETVDQASPTRSREKSSPRRLALFGAVSLLTMFVLNDLLVLWLVAVMDKDRSQDPVAGEPSTETNLPNTHSPRAPGPEAVTENVEDPWPPPTDFAPKVNTTQDWSPYWVCCPLGDGCTVLGDFAVITIDDVRLRDDALDDPGLGNADRGQHKIWARRAETKTPKCKGWVQIRIARPGASRLERPSE